MLSVPVPVSCLCLWQSLFTPFPVHCLSLFSAHYLCVGVIVISCMLLLSSFPRFSFFTLTLTEHTSPHLPFFSHFYFFSFYFITLNNGRSLSPHSTTTITSTMDHDMKEERMSPVMMGAMCPDPPHPSSPEEPRDLSIKRKVQA